MQANLQYLAAKAEKVPMSSESLDMGQFLIFKFGEDWFRGAVVKVKGDKVKMFSLDFGFSSRSFRVTEENLQPLPSEETERAKFWASPCSPARTTPSSTRGSSRRETGWRCQSSVWRTSSTSSRAIEQ